VRKVEDSDFLRRRSEKVQISLVEKITIIRKKKSYISVHVGNNEHTAATHSGTLSVTVCDNSGLELYKVSFPDMHLVPQAPYNIVSVPNVWKAVGSCPATR
jgi:hypothetical protein